ncbi:MAG: dihydropteroate synthase [Eggerthellaceae bacterium]|nr:dihydropteroate synthase [Eggerthellaceae bacterium]
MKWHCASFEFDTRMPILMGILNITPDSFSDGGLFADEEAALAHANEMIAQGARIIDIGGESTRPGAEPTSEAEELARVVGVVRRLAGEGVCVSIDTRHASVAAACIEAGASIINDISGFEDPAMFALATSCDAGLVVMHMQGEPLTMQKDPHYKDVVSEVKEYLRTQAQKLEEAGVAHARISIDPGPGFGKAFRDTLDLVRNLHEFVHLGYPVVAALSRKYYIGHLHHIRVPERRDAASAEEALMACELGASIVRTHNVACTAQALEALRPYALLGLGSNIALVGQPGEEREGKSAQLDLMVGMISELPDTLLVDVSSYYESEPAYYEDQDLFVNAVALIRTGLSPEELLDQAHVIENSLGRRRTIHYGPRTCDIDILDYQGELRGTETLTLPHPLILERDFVVAPLLEICPGHVLANGVEVTADHVEVGKASRIEQPEEPGGPQRRH